MMITPTTIAILKSRARISLLFVDNTSMIRSNTDVVDFYSRRGRVIFTTFLAFSFVRGHFIVTFYVNFISYRHARH